MKKYLLTLLTIFTACQTPQKEIVNLTYVKSPLNIPLIIGYQKKIFEKHFATLGMKTAWHEINSGAKQTEAIVAGSVDISPVLGGTSLILADGNGANIKLLGMFSRAPKAFVMMTKSPKILTVADLKGKKIGGPKGSVLHQLLAASLMQANLGMDDVVFISMGFTEAISALANGSLDAALLPSNVAQSVINFGGRVLTDGEGLIQGATVSAVSGKFAQKYPQVIKAFLAAQRESLQYMNDNLEESIILAADALKISADEVRDLLPNYNFDPTITPTDLADLAATQDFLVEAGLMNKKISIDSLLYK